MVIAKLRLMGPKEKIGMTSMSSIENILVTRTSLRINMPVMAMVGIEKNRNVYAAIS